MISIPYGAIKRKKVAKRAAGSAKFQFLMVRLKELTDYDRTQVDNISIPYGAIKSSFDTNGFMRFN